MQNDETKIGKTKKVDCMGNPEPSLSNSRIEVKCSICGKVKSVTPYVFNKNGTGHFYCGLGCLGIGHQKYFSGSHNPFFGKKHSKEALAKMNRAGSGKVETVKCPKCKKEFTKPYRNDPKNSHKYCSSECAHAARRKRFQVKCSFCSKELERVEFYKGKNLHFFCSRICRSQYKSAHNREQKTCSYCGKKYSVINHRKESARYCSSECYQIAKLDLTVLELEKIKQAFPGWKGGEKVTLKCERCGVEYETRVRRFLQGQRFCTMTCYVSSEIWNGGSSFEPYDEGFNRKIKSAIRKRDGYKCQLCGIGENGKRLHIHHIDYDKKHSNPRNLISLCNSCHNKTTSNSRREYWTKYFRTLLSGQEGATTIPTGSTPQANGGGSAEYPSYMGNDIVCSSRKLEAAS